MRFVEAGLAPHSGTARRDAHDRHRPWEARRDRANSGERMSGTSIARRPADPISPVRCAAAALARAASWRMSQSLAILCRPC